MERKDFIEQVGLSGASILIFGCMQACSKSETTSNTNNNNVIVGPFDGSVFGVEFGLQ